MQMSESVALVRALRSISRTLEHVETIIGKIRFFENWPIQGYSLFDLNQIGPIASHRPEWKLGMYLLPCPNRMRHSGIHHAKTRGCLDTQLAQYPLTLIRISFILTFSRERRSLIEGQVLDSIRGGDLRPTFFPN